jgi:uncharacterized protein YecE (DUF72 family)
MARVLIGTSGWHYDSWRGPFFPIGLPIKSQLQFYASQFSSAELNGVFYRTPTREAVESWRFQTGKDFLFAWKASKFITHWKRLSESSANSLELLEDRLSLLGNKVGPILFSSHRTSKRTQIGSMAFSGCCRASAGTASNSRSNLVRAAHSQERNISLCISDHHDAPAPWKRTADFVYVRGHGPGGRYKGHYCASATPNAMTGCSARAATAGRCRVTEKPMTAVATVMQ